MDGERMSTWRPSPVEDPNGEVSPMACAILEYCRDREAQLGAKNPEDHASGARAFDVVDAIPFALDSGTCLVGPLGEDE
jgi:hypothetical protein